MPRQERESDNVTLTKKEKKRQKNNERKKSVRSVYILYGLSTAQKKKEKELQRNCIYTLKKYTLTLNSATAMKDTN